MANKTKKQKYYYYKLSSPFGSWGNGLADSTIEDVAEDLKLIVKNNPQFKKWVLELKEDEE